MKIVKIAALLFLGTSFFLPLARGAEEGQEIKALEVKGNIRVSTLVILAKIKMKAGDIYSSRVIREDVKRLYELGYFSDVSVDAEDFEGGVKITFMVTEEFRIKEVNFQGTKALKEKHLREIMNLSKEKVFNKRLLAEDIEKITALYREKSFYLARVEADIERFEVDKQVIINIVINEGANVKVKQIMLEGNYHFSDKKIKKIMATRADGWFSKGIFSEEYFQNDLENIVIYYQNEGFIKAKITSAEKELDDALMYITIKIEEGPRFQVGKITLEGNTLYPDKEIKAELKMTKDDVYSPRGMGEDVRNISLYYAHKGYIFAEVREDARVNEAEEKVDITYRIVERGLAYVERIEIKGNIKTKDKVLRRELTIMPGDVFDARKIERSRQKLYNLGYFDEVSYYVSEGSAYNKKNLTFEVIERKTGTFMFGFGYSTIDDMVGFIEIAQNNFDINNSPTFTGGGQKVRVRTQMGTEKAEYNISFTEPWLFDRPLSAGFDIYSTARDWGDYDEERQGGDLRLGHPLGEFTRGSLTYRLEEVTIKRVATTASSAIRAEEGTFSTSSLKGGLIKDTRDNIFDPTKGYRNSFSAELAGGPLGADRDFTRYIGETSWYFQTFERWEELILNLRFKGGWVEEYGDTTRLPIYERFYLGGANSIRGYAYRDIGPKDANDEPVGGEVLAQLNAEYTYPIIRTVKGAFFFDSGGVWESKSDIDGSGIKSGVGIGVRLRLPIGPIRLDYGYGIDRGKGRMHFSGGWNF